MSPEQTQPATRLELESLLASNEAMLDNLPDPLTMVDNAIKNGRAETPVSITAEPSAEGG